MSLSQPQSIVEFNSGSLPYPSILVVDETGNGLGRLLRKLQGLGVECLIARTLTDAVDLLNRQRFALVLLNAKIRKGNYDTWIAAIRETDQGKDLPLIPVLGNSLKDQSVYEGFPTNSSQYQFNPIAVDFLFQKIKMHLEIIKYKNEMEWMWGNMRRAQVALEEKRNEFEQFASIAATDLQDPLRKISMFSSRLEVDENGLNVSQLNYLERLKKSAGRMQDYIRDVISYFNTLAQSDVRARVNLNSEVATVLEDFGREIRETHAMVEVGQLPELSGNRQQFRMLFWNLVSNALKFRHAGRPPCIRVIARCFSDGHWEIRVEDNGIGLAPQYAERIFRPFERLHSPDVYPGSGLGLTVCKSIMRTHEGRIRVESTLGEGAIFILQFPPDNPSC